MTGSASQQQESEVELMRNQMHRYLTNLREQVEELSNSAPEQKLDLMKSFIDKVLPFLDESRTVYHSAIDFSTYAPEQKLALKNFVNNILYITNNSEIDKIFNQNSDVAELFREFVQATRSLQKLNGNHFELLGNLESVIEELQHLQQQTRVPNVSSGGTAAVLPEAVGGAVEMVNEGQVSELSKKREELSKLLKARYGEVAINAVRSHDNGSRWNSVNFLEGAIRLSLASRLHFINDLPTIEEGQQGYADEFLRPDYNRCFRTVTDKKLKINVYDRNEALTNVLKGLKVDSTFQNRKVYLDSFISDHKDNEKINRFIDGFVVGNREFQRCVREMRDRQHLSTKEQFEKWQKAISEFEEVERGYFEYLRGLEENIKDKIDSLLQPVAHPVENSMTPSSSEVSSDTGGPAIVASSPRSGVAEAELLLHLASNPRSNGTANDPRRRESTPDRSFESSKEVAIHGFQGFEDFERLTRPDEFSADSNDNVSADIFPAESTVIASSSEASFDTSGSAIDGTDRHFDDSTPEAKRARLESDPVGSIEKKPESDIESDNEYTMSAQGYESGNSLNSKPDRDQIGEFEFESIAPDRDKIADIVFESLPKTQGTPPKSNLIKSPRASSSHFINNSGRRG